MRVWVLMHRGRERWCEYESEWVEADLTFPCQHTMTCSKCGATS